MGTTSICTGTKKSLLNKYTSVWVLPAHAQTPKIHPQTIKYPVIHGFNHTLIYSYVGYKSLQIKRTIHPNYIPGVTPPATTCEKLQRLQSDIISFKNDFSHSRQREHGMIDDFIIGKLRIIQSKRVKKKKNGNLLSPVFKLH